MHFNRAVFIDEDFLPLPTARPIRVVGTEPALVALYRETGSVAQISRFIRRNGIRHPAFVSGGLEVEVING
ncbi:hypothetical protein XBJ1_2644 [Xenorhabdus bovienii SS-2004]|uniref:Uncharacterized protein n=1 Tax=Xenorhabdus bovienii (strain SS-2004) TaxID=406818 RepID=D3V7F6_XENBS|nr:hypothetical protein [Xenorhabdus bovienii]CBJ81768.1 hypothetical protein XBJ1_2644 [Xenorhabdus bovienii SS-2004]